MKDIKKYYDESVKQELRKQFAYKNVMQIPRLVKIVVSRGLGESTQNSKCVELSLETFKDISGQKPIATKSKKAISNFKLRENQIIGCLVTLRGQRMYDFFTKFVNLALPKIRDFQGVSPKNFDGRGNYSLGIKEEIIFPEVKFDKLDKIRGMNITLVTNAKTNEEAMALLQLMGLPFQKREKIKSTKE